MNMKIKKESILTGFPNVISYECTQKIIEQMEKSICKIKIEGEQGTGFFCKIPYPDKNNILPVFITNNHLINEALLYRKDSKISLDIKSEKEPKLINLNNRLKYTSIEYDITIIEIKDNDNIKNFLKLDKNIVMDIENNMNVNSNKDFIDKTIYIIQYPEGELSVSYGTLDTIYEDKKYNFNHKCCTKNGSSGAPILTNKNKLIGIHKEGIFNNYNIGTFLNYPIKEFIELKNKKNMNVTDINKIYLKEFNEKYNLQIENEEIQELDLSLKILGNKGLKYLSKIEFNKLKKLNLNYNYISDINILEYANYNELKDLFLNDNKISDISVLDKVNLNKLEKLYLNCNKITDISILVKANFPELKVLSFYHNNISDIDALEKVNFPELKILDISDNNISDIKILEKVKFIKLEEIYLESNKISNIQILEKVNFPNIKKLSLGGMSYGNYIVDINVLEKVKFPILESLFLRKNKIKDINVFEKANFKELKELYVNDNKISDIKVFEKVDFTNLETLNLSDNKIDKIKNESIILKLKSKIGYFNI